MPGRVRMERLRRLREKLRLLRMRTPRVREGKEGRPGSEGESPVRRQVADHVLPDTRNDEGRIREGRLRSQPGDGSPEDGEERSPRMRVRPDRRGEGRKIRLPRGDGEIQESLPLTQNVR